MSKKYSNISTHQIWQNYIQFFSNDITGKKCVMLIKHEIHVQQTWLNFLVFISVFFQALNKCMLESVLAWRGCKLHTHKW